MRFFRRQIAGEGDCLSKALLSLQQGDLKSSSDQLTQAARLNSDRLETYLVLGELFRLQRDPSRSMSICHSLLARPDLSRNIRFQALSQLGHSQEELGFLRESLQTYQQLWDLSPHESWIKNAIIRTVQKLKDWETLIRWEKILKQDPEGKTALAYALGERHFEQQDYQKAVTYFLQAIRQQKPLILWLWGKLQEAAIEAQQLPRLKSEMLAWHEQEPSEYLLWGLGQLSLHEGQADKGKLFFEQSLDINSAFWPSYSELFALSSFERNSPSDFVDRLAKHILGIPKKLVCARCEREYGDLVFYCDCGNTPLQLWNPLAKLP